MKDLTVDDALAILGRITSPEALQCDFLRLQRLFSAFIAEHNLKDSIYNVCRLICRLLYLNYEDFLPETAHQISALYFLLSVYQRGTNPFVGFIFDFINIDAYRTLNRTSADQASEQPSRVRSLNIESESSSTVPESELLERFKKLHSDLVAEYKLHEQSLKVPSLHSKIPLSLNIYTVEGFPSLPMVSKMVFYGLLTDRYTPETYTLTPELLAFKFDRHETHPIRSKFDGIAIAEAIKKSNVQHYEFPFCPIYVFENFFADRNHERTKLLKMIVEDLRTSGSPSLPPRFFPPLLRPPPPAAPIQEQEFDLPYPTMLDSLELEWNDDKQEVKGQEVKELKASMKKAFKMHYYQTVTHNIVQKLNNHQEIVFEIGLTPERFLDLVKYNARLAAEVIVILVTHCQADDPKVTHDQVGEYLMKLISIDISLQAMEMINELSSRLVLPREFMRRFVSLSIKSCDNIDDKASKARLVRLNCRFLQSLITNKLIDVADILNEVQVFCLENNKNKEATSLYQMIVTDKDDQ